MSVFDPDKYFHRVSDIPFDKNDSIYKEYEEKVPQFTGQAVYIYSFEKNIFLLHSNCEYYFLFL